MKTKFIINAALTAVVVSGGLAFSNSQNNVSAQASRKYNHVVHVRRTRVHVKVKHLYTSTSLHHRRRINNHKTFTYSKYIHFHKKHKHGVYKYVSSGKVHGWVKAKYVKKVKAAKHKYVPKKHKKTIKKSVTIKIPNTNKKVTNKTKPKSKVNAPVSKKNVQYVPNKENIKNEFKKLLDPYLVKYGKTYGIPKDYGTPAGKLIVPIADSNGYGDEFAVTFGTAVRSDKEMAKTLFNSLLNGTLMSYLEDHSDVSVIVDHIDIDPSDGIIEAKLYLTWYQDRNITPKFAIVNGTPTYFY